jgi:hypothetical protein
MSTAPAHQGKSWSTNSYVSWSDVVPPAGQHAEGWRSDQGLLTGRLVIEGVFPVDPAGGDG